MSRGPGHVQRKINKIFGEQPTTKASDADYKNKAPHIIRSLAVVAHTIRSSSPIAPKRMLRRSSEEIKGHIEWYIGGGVLNGQSM